MRFACLFVCFLKIQPEIMLEMKISGNHLKISAENLANRMNQLKTRELRIEDKTEEVGYPGKVNEEF